MIPFVRIMMSIYVFTAGFLPEARYDVRDNVNVRERAKCAVKPTHFIYFNINMDNYIRPASL